MRTVNVIPVTRALTAKNDDLVHYADGGPRAPTDSPFATDVDRNGEPRIPGYVDTDAIGVFHP